MYRVRLIFERREFGVDFFLEKFRTLGYFQSVSLRILRTIERGSRKRHGICTIRELLSWNCQLLVRFIPVV